MSSRNLLVCLVEIHRILETMAEVQDGEGVRTSVQDGEEVIPSVQDGDVVTSSVQEETIVFHEDVSVKCDSAVFTTRTSEEVLLEINPESSQLKVLALPDLVPREQVYPDQHSAECIVEESSEEKQNLPDLVPRSDILNPLEGWKGVGLLPDIVTCSLSSTRTRPGAKSRLTLSEYLKPTLSGDRSRPIRPRRGKKENLQSQSENRLSGESWVEAGRRLKQIADGFQQQERSEVDTAPAQTSLLGRFSWMNLVLEQGPMNQLLLQGPGAEDEVDGDQPRLEPRNLFAELSVSLLFKFALYVTLRKLQNVL